jgi:hypothetical protein
VLGTALTVLTLAVWTAPGTAAGVKPGEMITADTAARVKDAVSPGIFIRVQGGMQMKIVPSQRVDWPPPYKDATEKYSAQVRLSRDHRTAVGYVAGQPFPLIDPNDPDVGIKIAWNNVFRPITSDDYDLRFFDCNAHYISRGKGTSLELDDTEVGHYAGYSEVGRTEVEPMPVDPDYKLTGRLWLFGLYPVLAPATQRGAGLIRFRYSDPKKGDDSWSYTPGARRVRRLNEAVLSDATLCSARGTKRCSRASMPSIRLKSPARLTVARVPAPRRGNIVICIFSRPSPGTASSTPSRVETCCTWTRKSGSSHTSTPTIRKASCSRISCTC